MFRWVRGLAGGAFAPGLAALPWFVQGVTITRAYTAALVAALSARLVVMVYQRVLSASAARRPYAERYAVTTRIERSRRWGRGATVAAAALAAGLLARVVGR